MKKNTALVILKIMAIFITSISIFLIAFYQYAGVGVLSKANNENRIEDFTFSDITENPEINPEAVIQNNSGIQVQLDDSNGIINVIEIDVEEIANSKIMARMYYTFDGKFTTANSVVLDLRGGRNYVSLNKNNLTELYFDFPMDKIKISAITINPYYSIAAVIRNSVLIISLNLMVLLFCFFILDRNFFFPGERLFIGNKVLWIVLLFYFDKFFIIVDRALNSYVLAFLFLSILLLVFIFLKIISKKNMGEINEN